MSQDVELNEPLIDVFKATNVNAVHRVLERAQRNAERAAKAQRSGSKPSRKPGALTKALNAAMSAYGRSAKDRPSIRHTAPDTGGRPYHFGYSHVTKGERKGASGRAETAAGGNGKTGNGTGAKATGGKADAGTAAKTAEAAHQRYTERDAAVEKDVRELAPEGPNTGLQRRPGPEAAADGINADLDPDGPDGPPGDGMAAAGPRRKRRRTEAETDTGLTRDYAESVIGDGKGIDGRAREAAAQAYIEDPSKRPGALMGTTASFGTIGATLEERMAFWDLVHEHESAKGGRTQSRLVLELPHEATAEDRHEIVRRYTDEFRRKGIPFWASIHAPTRKNDSRNHHAHVVFTDRPMRRMRHPETGETVWDFTVEEVHVKKNRVRVVRHPYRQNRDPEMRDRGWVKSARGRFSDVVNEVMKRSANSVRYDPRSYKDMGLDVAPMKNVTRILADKLGKRSFVVMDAEWTRRMVDAEVRAAAVRRDRTFVELQEAERRLQEAARDVQAANKANARLPRRLRISPGQAIGRKTAEAIVGKILTVRRDRLAAMLAFIQVIKSVGLDTAQGLLLTKSFYWDLNSRTRAFMERIRPKLGGNYVSSEQAGTYAATLHYLKAAADLGVAAAKANGAAAVARMKAMPTDDDCYGTLRIRADGQALHPAYLFQVKAPGESTGPWDLYKLVSTTSGEDAAPPIESCKLSG